MMIDWKKMNFFVVPGIPGRFRFFFVVGFGGTVRLPEEDTLASPEAVETLSKSTGMGTLNDSRIS